jgi:8-oxo-dGTP pyrophosphatase MutT (NUDIX family)
MDLIEHLRARLREPLPGIDAHREMVPQWPDAERRLTSPAADAKRSAVLVPFIIHDDATPELLFTLRSDTLRTHRGQISFPGGRMDEGEDPTTTALRELQEEVGIPPEHVMVLGAMSQLYIPPSNSAVFPIVGVVHEPSQWQISEAEVQEVFTVPITQFLDDSTVQREQWEIYGQSVNVPHWKVHHTVPLWGATAMILNELRWLLRGARAVRGAVIAMLMLVLVTACTNDDLNDRLVNATVDVMIAREMGQDTVAAQQRARVALQRHGYTVEQYEREYRDVASNGERYRAFADSVQSRLAARQDSVSKNR